MGYTKTAIKGISWAGSLSFFSRGISFLRTIVFARILNPAQFGVYGIALLIMALLETLTETGVNVILVQEKENIEKYISTAWLVSIIRGIIIALVIILSAPFIAAFFHAPGVLGVMLLVSVVPFLRGFINPSEVTFQKDLKFHQEFWYRIAIFAFDTVISLAMVYMIHSVIGIIWGLIAGVVLEVVLSFVLLSPRPNLNIEKGYLSKIVNKGKWVTLSGIFNYLFHNFDTIVVGRILGAGGLGLYEMAYNISMLPITDVADVISKVTFPVYTKISEDKFRLRKAFLKTVVLVSLILLPFGILIVFPYEIVKIVLGQKWLGIVDVLRILVIFGVIRAISGSTSALFLSVGKQRYVTIVTLVSMLGLAVTIVPLVLKMGIYGAGVSVLIGTLVALPFMLYFTVKTLK